MAEDEPIDPEEQELISALCGLQPADAGTNAREIWYRAGLDAGGRGLVKWRIAALVALGLSFALSWVHRPMPTTTERIVYVRQEPASPPEAPFATSSDGYAALRESVIEHGLDGLPPPHFADSGIPRAEVPHSDEPLLQDSRYTQDRG